MAVIGTPTNIVGAGEYGATTVELTKDGGTLRVAFGRNVSNNAKIFHGAVLLSPEAIAELKAQLSELDRA